MKKYKDFIFELKEGLITTHDINKYYHNITDYLSQNDIEFSINIIDNLEFKLTIKTIDDEIIDIINHRCYVLGYFPSYYWVKKNGIIKGMKKISTLKNVEEVTIKYEAKYEDGLYKNTILCPNKLYHLSYQENKNSIINKGLYPKSKNRSSVHPERIYLFSNYDDNDNLLNSLKYSDLKNKINKNYILLEIDCEKNKLILHTDPNYRLGFFTYDNINPKYIKILKENI